MRILKTTLFFLCTLNISTVLAERHSVGGDVASLNKQLEISVNQDQIANEISTVNLNGYIRGAGRYAVHLDLQRKPSGSFASGRIALFQGQASFLNNSKSAGGVAAVTLTRAAKKSKLRLFIESDGYRSRNANRGYELRADLLRDGTVSSPKLIRSRRRLAQTKSCGLDLINNKVGSYASSHKHRHAPRLRTSVALKSIDLQAEGDTEFFAKFTDPVGELNTIINLADAYYRRDVAMTFSANIIQTAQPYSSVIQFDSNYDLDTHVELRNKYPDRTADLLYVFSGKQPAGSDLQNLAGMVPGLGNVCSKPSDALGMVIRYATTTDDALTFAHEAGHNFNAEHDDSITGGVGYIMFSGTKSVDSFVNEFSTYSKNQINSYVSENNSCLGDTTGDVPVIDDPDPVTSELDLYAYKEREGRRTYLAGEAYLGEEPVSGQTLELIYKRTKKSSTITVLNYDETDEDGVVYFLMRKSGFYAVRTEDGLSTSRFIRK